jgi:hypothetical protein
MAGVLALVAATYFPTLGFGLVYDDAWTLLSNGFLREPALDRLWSPRGAAEHVPDAFRPTLVLFDIGAHALLGVRPGLHHAVSVALHLATCVALERLLARLAAPLRLRAGAVALFGLMAIHAEAVAVVSFREDLLAAALGLSGLVFASRALAASGRRRVLALAAACVLIALASGAKASAVALPGFWWLAETASPWRARPGARARLWLAAALQLAALTSFAQTYAVFGSFSPYAAQAHPGVLASRTGLGPVLAESARIHAVYLRDMVLPFALSPEHVDRGAAWNELGPWVGATVIASAAILGARALGRGPRTVGLALLGWLWLCLPTSNLVGLPNMQADRFMYLPSVAVCIGLAAAAETGGDLLVQRTRRGAWLVAPIAVYAVVQGAMARATASTYASNHTLWTVAVERAPGSARAQAMAGLNLLERAGERELPDEQALARVEARCGQAEALDPAEALAQICHARLALARRDWATAHRRFLAAVTLAPHRSDRALAALAEVSLDRPGPAFAEREREAFAHAVRGLREFPYSPDVAVAAARICHRTGRPRLALYWLRTARRLRPERWQTVIAGLELALDLGHAPAARRLWLDATPLVERADPAIRAALAARMADAQRLFPDPPPSPLASGVFPDAP